MLEAPMTQCQLLHSPRKMVESLFLVFLIVCLRNVARSIKTEYIYSTHIDICALYPKVQRCHRFCVRLLCRFDMNCLTFLIYATPVKCRVWWGLYEYKYLLNFVYCSFFANLFIMININLYLLAFSLSKTVILYLLCKALLWCLVLFPIYQHWIKL
jgi:hypothetical protein